MTGTLDYIVKKFSVNLDQRSPIVIEGVNRPIMAQTLHELDFKVGAEIGVAAGQHAKLLLDTIPGLKLYGVDIWEHYKGYTDYQKAALDIYEARARAILAPYNCEIIRKFSMDAVNDFEDGSLDFVYVDGAHDFKNVAMDLCEWTKKVRSGGIVYGHDYQRSKRGAQWICHVKDVVNAYTYSHGIIPWFILDTRGAVPREGSYSWMWIAK